MASRAYYAVYHLVAALLQEKAGVSRSPWRAEVLRRDFADHFTRRGYLFSVRDQSLFGRLLDERLAADYGNKAFNRRRAEAALRDAQNLYSRLEEVIRNA